MPRKYNPNAQEIAFIVNNAHKGGIWLSEHLGVNVEAIYQWGHDNKISVKKRDYDPFRHLKKLSSTWPKHWRRYKKFIINRDGLTCHYCHTPLTEQEVQLDHIVPRVRGGSDAPCNLVIACARCNLLKGSSCYSCPEFREAINNAT